MFKQLLITLTALSMSTLIFAKPEEINKKITCDVAKEMLPFIVEKYDEKPVWIGNVTAGDNPVYIALTVNPDTRTWTVLMYDRDISCLLENGEGYKYTKPESGGGTL
jgi:hypothetical protein